jgi:hypothetical protein
VLHNFDTGETWPRCESGSFERCEQRGEALLRELQKDYPDVGYALAAAGRRKLPNQNFFPAAENRL